MGDNGWRGVGGGRKTMMGEGRGGCTWGGGGVVGGICGGRRVVEERGGGRVAGGRQTKQSVMTGV